MAEYYALLARAVGALPRNDESARREIYVKARSALIRQLKAITPPLPPAEISKQRLSLEEAIRRVEREAAEAAAASRLSDEEISRRAEEALERALAPGGDDDPDRPSEFGGDALRMPPPVPQPQPASDSGPSFEPRPETAGPSATEPTMTPKAAPRPQPDTTPRDAEPAAQGERQDHPWDAAPAARGEEPVAEVVRPRPEERPGPRGTRWERAANVTDVEEAPARPRPSPPLEPETRKERKSRNAAAKRGGRGWGRTGAPHVKRSFVGMLGGLVLFLIVIGAAGYFLWDYYGDEITEFFGGEVAEEPANVDVAEGEGEAGAEIEEPPPFVETVGYLYTEPTAESPISERYEGTVEWAFVVDEGGDNYISASIGVPDQGLTVSVRFELSNDPQYSHEISALVTQSSRFQNDPIEVVDNLAIKTSEEGIGAAFEGDIVATPDLFLLALPENNEILNTNRIMQSPWFDLSIVYESGRRAILAFNKGTAGDEVFLAAQEAWAE